MAQNHPYRWTLMGEPVYQFYFKWESKNSVNFSIDKNGKRYNSSSFAEVQQRFEQKLTPSCAFGDEPNVTLQVTFRNGSSDLAVVSHLAVIDIPNAAGKWNTFALPASKDWLTDFKPDNDKRGDGSAGLVSWKAKYQSALNSAYSTGNKEEYKKTMLEMFREADKSN